MATPITVIITDLGNDVQFTLSNGHKYTLNKLSMRVKQNDEYVFITNAGGFIDSGENKTIRLKYSDVTSPSYASNDLLFAGLISMASSVSLGGGGGAGGGNNTWSNAQEDFIATPTTGAKTITITGLGWTIDPINVASGIIKIIDSAGDVTSAKLTNISVSGNVITLGDEDNFSAGDTVSVTLVGQDKAYDNGLDSQIVSVLNPDSAKWTTPETLVSFSAQAAATLRYVIPMEGFDDISMHWKFSNSNAGDTITMTLWATNNAAADDSADTDWVDVTGDLLTKTLTVTNGTIEFWEQINNINPLKLMVKLVVVSAGATNAADIYIKKKY